LFTLAYESYQEFAPRLQPLVVDAVSWMSTQMKENKRILIEGANALMLDIDYGTYPYVTSSNACLGGTFTGLAISPFFIKKIVGVVKAYLTRVGNGPFPTEQMNVRMLSNKQHLGFFRLLMTSRKLVNTSKLGEKRLALLPEGNDDADGWIW
jgi:adenylosuccinate synthase